MVEHRSSAALSAFLMQQGHRWCKGVKVVVSDGSKAYKAAIGAHLGHARHVLDRFHVIRWFSAGLTQVRRDVQRRPEGSKPAFEPEVFRARVRAAETRRHPHRRRPGAPRRPLRRPPPPQGPAGRPCKNSTASTSPTTTTAPSSPWDGGLRPLRDRRAARIPQHSRHHHRLDRRDPRLAPQRPGLQRQNRGNQQPAPSAQAHRPRLHQPTQLRSPRHPRDIMTPTGASNPSSHVYAKGQMVLRQQALHITAVGGVHHPATVDVVAI